MAVLKLRNSTDVITFKYLILAATKYFIKLYSLKFVETRKIKYILQHVIVLYNYCKILQQLTLPHTQ